MAEEKKTQDLRTLSTQRFEQEVAQEIAEDLRRLRQREAKPESES